MEFLTREMPCGIQDFEKLREVNYMYVDKTKYIFSLSKKYKPYFLSRPRRFGKSLFASTLKAYFLGKKHLFEGLAIAKLEKEWIEYPVFYIDFNLENFTSLDLLHAAIDTNLRKLESKWGDDERETTLSSRFYGLITRAYEKTGRRVVVIVDEYDKPLVDSMDNNKLNSEMRGTLKGFYGVLKGIDYALRFVFITGVTKFAKVSIFSDMNQLIDISLDERYAEICGISEKELLDNFIPEINALAQKRKLTFETAVAELKRRYDGYRFAKESVRMYNPFSLLHVFERLDFGNFWFKTGTTTFLCKTLQKSNFDIRKFEDDVEILIDKIDEYRAGETSIIPLLFQTGYLTIKAFDVSENAFTLGFPNEEVKYGFLNELLPAFINNWGLDDSFSILTFLKNIKNGNVDAFMTLLKAYYASIPYDLEENRDKDEKYYQLVFYLLFKNIGQFIETEVKCAAGRADAVVKTADAIYVLEFKMSENATAEEALAQIDDKGYLIPYSADDRKLVKIGAEFCMKTRGLKRWVVD